MADLPSFTDQIIRDAMASGHFTRLPGEGRPLNLDDDRFTPEHLRLTHKILKDNELAPEWIMDGAELEASRADLLRALRRAASAYKRRERASYERDWAQARFERGAKDYNRKLLNYNLKVPPGVRQRANLEPTREIQLALDKA